MIVNIDYTKILEAVVAFSGETDYTKLMGIVLTKMREITNCEAGTLYMERDEKLYFSIVQNELLGIFTTEEDTGIPPVDLKQQPIENVCAYSAVHSKIINIDDVYTSKEFNFQGPRKYDAMTGFRTQSMLVFPLSDLRGHVIGVIQLLNSRDASGKIIPFDSTWEQIIWSLSYIAATALMNVRYLAEINDLFHSFVKMMTNAIDERSPYNANHTVNVAGFTQKFVQYLRSRFKPGSRYYFDENCEEQLVMAAYLHDVGKVVTPIEVMDKSTRLGAGLPFIIKKLSIKRLCEKVRFLSGELTEEEYNNQIEQLDDTLLFVERVNEQGFLQDEDLERVKTLVNITYPDEDGNICRVFEDVDIDNLSIRKGTLTDTERLIMQDHVRITERLLNNIKFNKQYENVPFWAKSHHEFIDGTGYPYNIAGSNVQDEVRILTMMDIFDALIARDRPYRKVMPYDQAIKILKSMADEGKLDNDLLQLFIESGIGQDTQDTGTV